MSSAELTRGQINKQAYNRRFNQEVRDNRNEIGELPEIKNPELRARMLESLRVFFAEGFPHIFSDEFGPVQISSIEHEQQMLERGGRNINKLEPRGYGKSTRSILGLVWSCLKGIQRFGLICSASKESAGELLEMAHRELGDNEILLSCFPELQCFHHLEGNPHKSKYQTYQGEKTEISIKGDTIVFPTLEGFVSSGAIIAARPFRKARGKNKNNQRPTVIVLDDIQDAEQAVSPTAITKNLKCLRSDIAFLGDRACPISIINNATIIAPDDYPDSLTVDRSFRTVRYKMVEQFPTSKEAEEHWNRYKEIRLEFVEGDDEDDAIRARIDALKYYKENRQVMDGDSKVTWDHAYSRKVDDYEISSIQAAYNFIIDYGQDAFDSECQNDPPKQKHDSDDLTKEHVKHKQHGQKRGIVPIEAEKLVCDIDVQGESLWSTIAAGSNSFESFVVDLEVYPKQSTIYPSKGSLSRKLSDEFKGADEDSRIYQGVKAVLGDMLQRQYKHGDGNKGFDAIAVDVKWNDRIIRRAIRDMNDSRILAYNGQGIGTTKAPMSSWRVSAGEKKGIHWHLRAAKAGVRNFISDVNFWKSFVKKHFLIPIGQAGSLSVFNSEDLRELETFARHLKAEVGKVAIDEVSGRKVEQWTLLPGEDNEWLDTTAGAMALLSYCGCECLGAENDKKINVRKGITKAF